MLKKSHDVKLRQKKLFAGLFFVIAAILAIRLKETKSLNEL